MTSTIDQRINSVWRNVPGLDARLRELAATVSSAGVIANKLCEEFPPHAINRNMVTGRIWRLGLGPRRNEPGAVERVIMVRKNPPAKVLRRAPAIAPVADLAVPPPQRKHYTLLDLPRGGCKWPVNDGEPEFLFCGNQRIEGESYCLTHCCIAYPHWTHR